MHKYPLVASVVAAVLFMPVLTAIIFGMYCLRLPVLIQSAMCVLVTLVCGLKLLPLFMKRWDRYCETR